MIITCCNMDEPWKHHAKKKKSDTKGHVGFCWYKMSRIDIIGDENVLKL